MIHPRLEFNLVTVVGGLLSLALVIPSTPLLAHADNINPGVYGIDSKPYGIPYYYGVNIKQLDKYRATSPLFNVTYPTYNLFGSPAGQTQGIADGFSVFLQPLAPGKHELHFSGLTPGNPTTGTSNFAIDATYHLTVK